MNDDTDSEIARLYPTYKIGRGDIGLKEYEFAAQATASDERNLANTSALIAVLVPILGAFAWSQASEVVNGAANPRNVTPTDVLMAGGVAIATYFFLTHLSNMRRNYVYAARKLIVLRRMLGQSYGSSNLVLPSWRLEGADSPYAIKMFPGLRARYLAPFYAIILLSGLVFIPPATRAIVPILPRLGISTSDYAPADVARIAALMLFLGWSGTGVFLTRRMLFDDNENWSLLAAKLIAKCLSIRLVGKYEYTLYRARLARAETYRLEVNLKTVSRIAVFREDRRFYRHGGYSPRSIARAVYRRARFGEHSGASTIAQQLARTLFIVRPDNSVRRKIVEILLAIWLSKRLPREELLEIYLASVRYERNVDGLLEAMKHFLGGIKPDPSPAECFFLIERIANIRSQFRASGVERSLRDAIANNVLLRSDAIDALALYARAISVGKIAQVDGKKPNEIAASFQ